jgi:hypothetical protein
MLMSPLGLRSEKGCADDAQQKLKTTDPTSRQRGRPKTANPQLFKNNQGEKGNNWSRVPDECLTPGRTGQLTVGHNITLTLTLTSRLELSYSAFAELLTGNLYIPTKVLRLVISVQVSLVFLCL